MQGKWAILIAAMSGWMLAVCPLQAQEAPPSGGNSPTTPQTQSKNALTGTLQTQPAPLVVPPSGGDPKNALTGTLQTQPASQPATKPKDRSVTWQSDKLDYHTRDDISMPWTKMLASLMILIALGVVALIVTRKVLPRIRPGAGRNLRVIETTYLAPRQAVHLVQVGTRQYLLASGKDGVTLLTEVSATFEEHVQDQLAKGPKPQEPAP